MASRALLYIGNTALPQPTKYNVTMVDIDSSDTLRNEKGVLVRNRVRQGATKIEVGWTLKSPAMAQILSLVAPAQFPVKFFDPRVYDYKDAQMYSGDRACELSIYTDATDFDGALWDISLSLIEY